MLVGFGGDDTPLGDFPAADHRYADFSPQDVAMTQYVWQYTVTSPERIGGRETFSHARPPGAGLTRHGRLCTSARRRLEE